MLLFCVARGGEEVAPGRYPSGLGGGCPGEFVLRSAAVAGYARNVGARNAKVIEFAVGEPAQLVKGPAVSLPLPEILSDVHFFTLHSVSALQMVRSLLPVFLFMEAI